MFTEYWSWGLSAVGILGIWLAGRKNLWGWAVGFGAQILWIAFALTTEQYGFIASAFAYGTIYGINWAKWRGDAREQAVAAEKERYRVAYEKGKKLRAELDDLID